MQEAAFKLRQVREEAAVEGSLLCRSVPGLFNAAIVFALFAFAMRARHGVMQGLY